tara:strand:+ start:5283 stop:5996 length:714 start_codon:yes stop_codon:yes gene_type:complete
MSWEDAAVAHAMQEAPKESCGLVVVVNGKLRYFPCENLAKEDEEFILSPQHWALCEEEGDIRYVVHSHPSGSPEPSVADKICCERGDTEWKIVNPFTKHWSSYKPCGYKPPLVGREWVWNLTDCWTLVRDWFKEKGIELKDWDRTETAEEFHAKPYFDDCWKDTGFKELEETEQLQEGDCLLMALGGMNANHVAVYTGNGEILHHLRDRLSSRDIYSTYLQKRTLRRLRYYDRERFA